MNETTIAAQLKVLKSGAGDDSGVISANLNMSGDDLGGYTQVVPADPDWGDAVTLQFPPDLATCGYMLIRNLSTVNFVELSLDKANPPTMKFAVIPPRGLMLYKPASTTIYCNADTAACVIQTWIVEE